MPDDLVPDFLREVDNVRARYDGLDRNLAAGFFNTNDKVHGINFTIWRDSAALARISHHKGEYRAEMGRFLAAAAVLFG